jgi:hypothetical protein
MKKVKEVKEEKIKNTLEEELKEEEQKTKQEKLSPEAIQAARDIGDSSVALIATSNIAMISVALSKSIVEEFLNDMFDKDILNKKQYSEYRDKALEYYQPEKAMDFISEFILKLNRGT